MSMLSFFVKQINRVLVKEKTSVFVSSHSGKTFYSRKRYDATGNTNEAETIGSSPFIGEVMLFAGNFAPLGWTFCQGQLLPISEYDALFALIGTTYGGDGQTTFGLPDLRSRIPIGIGQGPGLSSRVLGEQAGTESVTIEANNMPTIGQTVPIVKNRAVGTATTGVVEGRIDATRSLTVTGGGQSHTNIPPFLGLNFCIALYGIFPSQN